MTKSRVTLEDISLESYTDVHDALLRAMEEKVFNGSTQNIHYDLKSLHEAVDKQAFFDTLIKTPKRFQDMVKYIQLSGEISHMAGQITDANRQNVLAGYQRAITIAQDNPNKFSTLQTANTHLSNAAFVMRQLSAPGVRRESIGTEHPTEPLSLERLLAQEMFMDMVTVHQSILGEKKPEDLSLSELRYWKKALLQSIHNKLEEAEEIDPTHFEREVPGVERQFTRARNTLCDTYKGWEQELQEVKPKDKTEAGIKVFAEALKNASQRFLNDAFKVIGSVPATPPQKRPPERENARHLKFEVQEGRQLKEVWKLLHARLGDDPAIDMTQIVNNGNWSGDADGKPRVTAAVTRDAAKLQMTIKVEEAKKIIEEDILAAAKNTIKKAKKVIGKNEQVEALETHWENTQRLIRNNYLSRGKLPEHLWEEKEKKHFSESRQKRQQLLNALKEQHKEDDVKHGAVETLERQYAFMGDVELKLLRKLDHYNVKLNGVKKEKTPEAMPYSRYLSTPKFHKLLNGLRGAHAEAIEESKNQKENLSWLTFWATNQFYARIFIRQNASVDAFITTMMLEDAKNDSRFKDKNPLFVKYLSGKTYADLQEQEKQDFMRDLHTGKGEKIREQLKNWYENSHYAQGDNLRRFAARVISQNPDSEYLSELREEYNEKQLHNKKPSIPQGEAGNKLFAKIMAEEMKCIQQELDRNKEIRLAASQEDPVSNIYSTIQADCEEASDMLNRLFLMDVAGAYGKATVIPLHESEHSHANADKIYKTLSEHPMSRDHIMEGTKEVIKFNARSDSTKRSGLSGNTMVVEGDKAVAAMLDGHIVQEPDRDEVPEVGLEIRSRGPLPEGVSYRLKAGGGHNEFRGAGDVTLDPFKTIQGLHKRMKAFEPFAHRGNGMVVAGALLRQGNKELVQLSRELQNSLRAITADTSKAYATFRDAEVFYNALMEEAGPLRTTEEISNKSARGERLDTGNGQTAYKHLYAHLIGTPQKERKIVGEQRAIGDDAGSSTTTRTETNKLHSAYLEAYTSFRKNELTDAERKQHLVDLVKCDYEFRRQFIVHALACFYSNHELNFSFLPKDVWPEAKEGEFALNPEVQKMADKWKEFYTNNGYPETKEDIKEMIRNFRAFEAVNELETRKFVFDILCEVFPEKAKTAFSGGIPKTPSKQDMLFMFDPELRKQFVKDREILDIGTNLQAWVHFLRKDGKVMEKLAESQGWYDMKAVQSGGHDGLSTFLDAANLIVEAGRRLPSSILVPNFGLPEPEKSRHAIKVAGAGVSAFMQ
ncbi:MAG: hypothetical protein K0R63_1224 [Rickettsiales bacterium]|jgi:hypothetical protein|nr:hypothetical protein [Rickettsiales bacterium]